MKNLYKALAEFQYECPVIHKDTQGFGYTYADLPKIYEVIKPLLQKHGLGFTQYPQGTGLVTKVFHVESGEVEESYVEIPSGIELAKMNAFQVAGSAFSYYRRYALSSMLGIVTDKDIDAAGDQVSKPAQKTATKAPVAPQPVGNPNYDDVPFPTEEPVSVEDFTSAFGGKVVASKPAYAFSKETQEQQSGFKKCDTCVNVFEIKPGKEWATQCFSCWKKANPIKK